MLKYIYLADTAGEKSTHLVHLVARATSIILLSLIQV